MAKKHSQKTTNEAVDFNSLNREQLLTLAALVNKCEVNPQQADEGVHVSTVRIEMARIDARPDYSKDLKKAKEMNQRVLEELNGLEKLGFAHVFDGARACLVDPEVVNSRTLPSLESAQSEAKPIEFKIPDLSAIENFRVKDPKCAVVLLGVLYAQLQEKEADHIPLADLRVIIEGDIQLKKFLADKDALTCGKTIGRWISDLARMELVRYDKRKLYYVTKAGEDALSSGELPKELTSRSLRGNSHGNGKGSTDLDKLKTRRHALLIELHELDRQIEKRIQEAIDHEEQALEELGKEHRERLEALKKERESLKDS